MMLLAFRLIVFVSLGLVPLAAAAQPGAAECNRVELEKVLSTGEVPNFSGCSVRYAITRIQQTFPGRYQVKMINVGSVSGFKPGAVSRQTQDGRLIQLFVASRPEAPANTPVAAPPAIAPPPAVPAAPVAPPPPHPAAVDVNGMMVAPDALPPTAVSNQVSFSVSDAIAEEGKPLVFEITRHGDDDQRHEVLVRYEGDPQLLVQPAPSSLVFEAGDPPQKELIVQTTPGQSGDGDHQIRVLVRPAAQSGAIAEGTISDKAASGTTPPSTNRQKYSIVVDGSVSRGSDIRFKVSRTGSLNPAQVPYRIVQEGSTAMEDAVLPRLAFAEGQPDALLLVPAGKYDVCFGSVTVTLDDGVGTNARASFSDDPPAYCNTPWWKVLVDWLRGHWALVAGGVALFGTAGWLAKVIFEVHPSCTITPGELVLRPLEDELSHWPDVRSDVVMEPGELRVTQPLPRSEPVDG